MRIVKDLQPLFQKALEQGWKISYTGGGHLKWSSPITGNHIFSSSTPSGGRRSVDNLLSHLKREGFKHD